MAHELRVKPEESGRSEQACHGGGLAGRLVICEPKPQDGQCIEEEGFEGGYEACDEADAAEDSFANENACHEEGFGFKKPQERSA